MKFRRMMLVKHIKTGGLYRVMMDPSYAKIEATGEGAYGYTLNPIRSDGTLWIRPQAEMEDGRFELVEE